MPKKRKGKKAEPESSDADEEEDMDNPLFSSTEQAVNEMIAESQPGELKSILQTMNPV